MLEFMLDHPRQPHAMCWQKPRLRNGRHALVPRSATRSFALVIAGTESQFAFGSEAEEMLLDRDLADLLLLGGAISDVRAIGLEQPLGIEVCGDGGPLARLAKGVSSSLDAHDLGGDVRR